MADFAHRKILLNKGGRQNRACDTSFDQNKNHEIKIIIGTQGQKSNGKELLPIKGHGIEQNK